MRTIFAGAAASLALSLAAEAQPSFQITFPASVRPEPATGRLVLYMIRDHADIGPGTPPSNGPFWDDPQPLYGIDVANLAPGEAAVIDDRATSFPVKLSELPAGKYRVQAVLDLHRANSQWRREPGNLFSDPASIRLGETDGPTVHTLTLTRVIPARRLPSAAGFEVVEIRSRLLSDFHQREATLRAGVALPTGYDPRAERRYAAVYEVPGFGGDHTSAAGRAARSRAGDTAEAELARHCFWIVPDPESPNGHTLWADSANNGPVGRALVEELIPALEAKYRLIPEPSARLLRGHSSGGWSVAWLALTYPQTFGAAWSTSPDPVDFRRFQLPNIYDNPSMYHGPDGRPLSSYRNRRGERMSILQENLMEEVLGPDNTSGQQWDSWQAVFGPRNARGNPAALFDPRTGAIDRAVAEHYRAYDLSALLDRDPARYLPIFRDRIRMTVGDQDSFYLNEAVALLKERVEEHLARAGQAPGWGWIRITRGHDHGGIYAAPELRTIPDQMLEYLRKAGHIPTR